MSKVDDRNKEKATQANGADIDAGAEPTLEENGTAAVGDDLQRELDAVKAELGEKSSKCEEYLDKLQRIAAEFDNFKKRTVREKEALYSDAVSDVVSAFLPVIDSVEKAILSCSANEEFKALKEGVELIDRQIKDVLKNLGVEEIKCVNESFNPELHNGVMHVEDDSIGQNVVVEEFRKGYIFKDKVIRHSMVKVAN